MYYPFLRGKREELLAIQELLKEGRLSEKIIPIIEPVNISPTLIKTIELFCEKDRVIYLVANPIVGHFYEDYRVDLSGDETDQEKNQIEKIAENRYKLNGLIKNSQIKFALYYRNDFETFLKEKDAADGLIILFTKDDNLEDFFDSEYSEDIRFSTTFIPNIEEKESFINDIVLFRNRFNKASRNAEYPDDEFFSKDHILYRRYNLSGFSDYSIVGEKYDSGGFTPRAIAIHIVYVADNTSLHIKHFISDSNSTQKNPAGKFAEAGRKLYKWNQEYPDFGTLGLSRILEYYLAKKYPGLGCLKRYSIMHHLEIAGRIMDGT